MPARDDDFSAFVEARGPALLRMAHLLTGGSPDSPDLVQTTLANMYVAWPRIRAREALDAYARTSMARTLISWRRKRSSQMEVLTAEPTDRMADTPVEDDPDVRQRVVLALRRLTPQQRAAVVLRYYEDCTVPEVAAALGCSDATARSHLSRGLDRMRAQLPIDLGPGRAALKRRDRT